MQRNGWDEQIIAKNYNEDDYHTLNIQAIALSQDNYE